jgi:two-component system nitrogen regulation response regulator GlnG
MPRRAGAAVRSSYRLTINAHYLAMTHAAISDLPVLLVDDEPDLLYSVSVLLRTSGLTRVVTLDDSRAVLPLLEAQDVGVIVLDLAMPHLCGRTLLERVSADHPDVPVILLTATGDLDVAVRCMQAGALDYLVKPVEENRLLSSVNRALEIRAMRTELLALKQCVLGDAEYRREAFAEMVTRDKAMGAVFRYVEAVAPSPYPVLITGETGTGKELVARALHRLSTRAGEFVAVNVAGLDDTMFSDTLFGHAKGAYTGADRPREGLITAAAEGTLFLDEIGDLTVASQVKLLRLLQDGAYHPLGADRPRQSRARIVVATNCDVVQGVNAGTFRKDLYYRLRTHHLQLPPLRERADDLPLLVAHFVEKAARAFGKPAPMVPLALHQLLKSYCFPGNLRELEAMVLDAVARQRGGTLSLESFKNAMSGSRPLATGAQTTIVPASIAGALPDPLPKLKEAEDLLLTEALRRADGNQGVAATMLGITRQAVNQRLMRRKQPDSSARSQR